MMGERRVMQEAPFYGFSLERHVPDGHPGDGGVATSHFERPAEPLV